MTTTAPSQTYRNGALPADVPTRLFRIHLDGGDVIERRGRLKLDEGWLIINDRDADGHFVVFAAPALSVRYTEPVE